MKSIYTAPFALNLLFSATAVAQGLPTDLREVEEIYDSIAVPKLEQTESKFELEELTLERESYTHLRTIIQSEAVADEDGAYIEAFTAREIILSDNSALNDLNANTLNPGLLALRIYHEDPTEEYGPYYCGALKINEENNGEYLSSGCLEETQKITDRILRLGLKTILVEVKGNNYGDFRYNVLYVQSKTDESKYLRLYFDINHEI